MIFYLEIYLRCVMTDKDWHLVYIILSKRKVHIGFNKMLQRRSFEFLMSDYVELQHGKFKPCIIKFTKWTTWDIRNILLESRKAINAGIQTTQNFTFIHFEILDEASAISNCSYQLPDNCRSPAEVNEANRRCSVHWISRCRNMFVPTNTNSLGTTRSYLLKPSANTSY